MRNLYKVLGIASTADDLRIKSAFRRRAFRIHPDLHPGNERADERFRELMQAYQVLRDTRTRVIYDAYLARQRSQARRRFVQSAAVMATTFVLTTGSAFFFAGQQGISVHSQTWQIATAWLTSVEVEPATPGAQAIASAKTVPFTTTVVVAEPPGKAPAPARSRKSGTEPAAKPQTKVAAVAPKPAPANDDAARHDFWWPWSGVDEQPRYGLGASDLK